MSSPVQDETERIAASAAEALGECLACLETKSAVFVWETAGFARAKLGDRAVLAETLLGIWDGTDTRQQTQIMTDTGLCEVTLAPGKPGFLYVRLEDSLQRREAQSRHLADREQLMLTSRAISVGEMATTMAHELNQPLGSVSNLLNMLSVRAKKDTLTGEAAQPVIDRALTQIGYASGIISRIREYVDARKPARAAIDLRQLARDSMDLLDWEIQRYGVRTDIDIDEHITGLTGDAVMIQQVVINLARNAIEAMRVKPRNERRLILSAVREGAMIDLQISDTGTGLSDEQAAKLFTPFFSTKASGMGIGLNICRSIVELHRGSLWHSRNEWGGTMFHIELPMTKDEEATA